MMENERQFGNYVRQGNTEKDIEEETSKSGKRAFRIY
jgi:hypothetical protein